ncbi:MAG: hypothetical protein WCO81_00225 [Cyanobacteriota bacterium ELA615]
METFPIILIPEKLSRLASALPPCPPDPALLTSAKPGPTPTKLNITLVSLEAIGGVFLSGLLLKSNVTIALILFLFMSFVIVWQVYSQITTFEQRIKNHKNAISKYQESLKINKARLERHQQDYQKSLTPQRIADYREQIKMEILASASNPNTINRNVKSGRAEADFKEILAIYFSKRIMVKKGFNIPNFHYPYIPDFIYWDKKSNLYIDIEIDEPYVYDNGEPIHYLGSQRDCTRDRFFLEQNWLVIRFAEEQIIKYPHSCCKVVAQEIVKITGDDSLMLRFKNIAALKTVSQWTYAQAIDMAAKKVRNNNYS